MMYKQEFEDLLADYASTNQGIATDIDWGNSPDYAGAKEQRSQLVQVFVTMETQRDELLKAAKKLIHEMSGPDGPLPTFAEREAMKRLQQTIDKVENGER